MNVGALNHSRNTPRSSRCCTGVISKAPSIVSGRTCTTVVSTTGGRLRGCAHRSCACAIVGARRYRPLQPRGGTRVQRPATASTGGSTAAAAPSSPARTRQPQQGPAYDPAPTAAGGRAGGDDRGRRTVEPQDPRRRDHRDVRADDHRPRHGDPRVGHHGHARDRVRVRVRAAGDGLHDRPRLGLPHQPRRDAVVPGDPQGHAHPGRSTTGSPRWSARCSAGSSSSS